MIELKVLIDDLNYDSIAEYLIPALAESMARDQKGGILGGVLANNPDMLTSMARTLLGTLSQEKRDELLVQLLNKNREKLLQKANHKLMPYFRLFASGFGHHHIFEL